MGCQIRNFDVNTNFGSAHHSLSALIYASLGSAVVAVTCHQTFATGRKLREKKPLLQNLLVLLTCTELDCGSETFQDVKQSLKRMQVQLFFFSMLH